LLDQNGAYDLFILFIQERLAEFLPQNIPTDTAKQGESTTD
jgi:hypothetical protein